MTLTQLIYFEKLAEIENMGRTAQVLHISQPSLSISISKLEAELNIMLFNRVGHKLVLTEEGKQFLIHVKKILRDVQDAQVHMQSLSADRNSHIRIGCIAPVLYDYLPHIMRKFLLQPGNKNITTDFTTNNTDKLITMLKDGYYDFIICSHSTDPDLSQSVFVSEPIMLLCPPGADIPTSWNDILSKDLIGFHQRAAAHHELHSMLIQQGIQPDYLYRGPDEEGIASLVSQGFGYGFVPNVPSLTKYDLECVPLPEPNETFVRNIYITQVSNRMAVGAAKKFLNYLKKNPLA